MTREEYAGVIGYEVTADTSREGYVDDGNIAWPERIAQARVQWPQADVADFERIGRRRWRDRASGMEYREEPGAPLLSIGTDATRNISLFFICDGKLTFLSRADLPEGIVVHHGEYFGAEIVNGRIVKGSR
jgi:hypothetical protein